MLFEYDGISLCKFISDHHFINIFLLETLGLLLHCVPIYHLIILFFLLFYYLFVLNDVFNETLVLLNLSFQLLLLDLLYLEELVYHSIRASDWLFTISYIIILQFDLFILYVKLEVLVYLTL